MSAHEQEQAVELIGPKQDGLYSSQLHDWIPLCPRLSDSAVRLYWIMRSLVIEKYGPVRKITLAELRHLLPAKPAGEGEPVKPSSHSRIRTLLRMLSDVGLVSTPEGDRLTTSSRAKASLGPLRIRINDLPPAGYDGARNAFAQLDHIRPAARTTARQALDHEEQLAAAEPAVSAQRAAGRKSNPPAGEEGAGQEFGPPGQVFNPRGQESNPYPLVDLHERDLPLSPSAQSSRSVLSWGCSSAEGASPVARARANMVGRDVVGNEGALRAEQQRTGLSRLSPTVNQQAPQTAVLLADLIGEVSSFQQARLDRLVRGLLLEGEDDAMIAARLQKRLAPLATGKAEQPWAFRRDALSWALSIGLPYAPGGMTLLPCRNRRCGNLVRGRATDDVRCDGCELQALEEAEERQQSDMDAASASEAEPSRAEIARVLAHLAPSQQLADAHDGDGAAHRPGISAVPQVVREQIAVIAAASPAAGRAAEDAAAAMYGAGPDGEREVTRRKRVSQAASVFHAVTGRYDELLADHYSGSRL